MSHPMDPFFTGSLPTWLKPEHVLRTHSAYERNELDKMYEDLQKGHFDSGMYPKIVEAVSGVPYCREVDVGDGQKGSMLKVLVLNPEEMSTEMIGHVGLLSACVQGHYEDGEAKEGFMALKDKMIGNRGGEESAFTTGINLYLHYLVNPAKNCIKEIAGNEKAGAWAEEFHKHLGDVANVVMNNCMTEEFLTFSKDRKKMVNAPCFGRDYDTQSFFTGTQVNCSTGDKQLEGTAGGVHIDKTDCRASYSMSINTSVIRESTNLGFFWFPNLDLVVKLRVGQVLIFQGVEEHTGTGMIIDPTDTTPLDRGYTKDVRFNIVAYPKARIFNGTASLNIGKGMKRMFAQEEQDVGGQWNLMDNALPHFGGKNNYDKWRAITIARETLKQWKIPGFTLNPNGINFRSDNNYISEPDESAITEEDVQKLQMRRIEISAIVRKHLVKMYTKAAVMEGGVGENDIEMEEETASNDEGDGPPPPARIPPPTDEELLTHFTTSRQEGQTFTAPGDEEGDVDSADEESPLEGGNADAQGPDTLPRGKSDAITSFKSFLRKYRRVFDLATIDEELARSKKMETIDLGGSFQKDIANLIGQLPPPSALQLFDPTSISNNCLDYGSVMGSLSTKQEQSTSFFRGVRAAQLWTILEVIQLFGARRNQTQEPDFTGNDPNSLGVRLYEYIDAQYSLWMASDDDEHVLEINAKEFLGKRYNPALHLNVHLAGRITKGPRADQEAASVKSYILLQCFWGLTLHLPISNLYHTLLVRGHHKKIEVYKDRLQSWKNDLRRRMINRFRFYFQWVQQLSGGSDSLDGFFMLDGLLEVAIGHHPVDSFDPDIYADCLQKYFTTDTLDNDMDGDSDSDEESTGREHLQMKALRKTKIGQLAEAHENLFDMRDLLKNRASHRKVAFSQLHLRQPAKSQSAKSTGKKRKSTADHSPRDGTASKWSKPTFQPQYQFMPADSITSSTTTDSFTLHAYRCFYHSFQVGMEIVDIMRAQTPAVLAKMEFDNPLLAHIPGERTKRYVTRAVRSVTNGDRFIALRLKGPSIQGFVKHYPLHTIQSAGQGLYSFIWDLLVFRVFGFGRGEFNNGLMGKGTPQATLSAIRAYEALPGTSSTVGIPAYGNYNIPIDKREVVLVGLERLSRKIALTIERDGSESTFAQLGKCFEEVNVGYVKAGGIVWWLALCDLSEYALCAAPTIEDLMVKMGPPSIEGGKWSTTGGEGPRAALAIIADSAGMSKMPITSAGKLKTFLLSLTESMEGLVDKSEAYQGRCLNVADLEHILCKITREGGVKVKA